MKIVCIGDSLTFGYGIKKDLCWVELLKKSTSHSIVNKGVNGDTTPGILSRFYRDVTSHGYDLCTIMAGTNDLLIGRSLNSIIENIALMIKECLESKITPLVMVPPFCNEELARTYWDPSINYSHINNQITLLRDSLFRLSAKDAIDIIDLTIVIPIDKNYYSDGLHISELGNEIIYDNVKLKIENLK